jgi:polysaccharide biosynthesis/export protein
VSDLFSKRFTISPRVTDAPSRGAALINWEAADECATKKQQDELTRKLEKLDDQRRLDLRREQQDAGVRLNEIRESCKASARRFSTLRWFGHNSCGELAIKRRLPLSEKAKKGRNGLSQAKTLSCSRATPSRSPCNTRMVLTRLSAG